MLRLFLLSLLPSLIAALTLPAFGRSEAQPQRQPAPAATIVIKDTTFEKPKVEVKAGETVLWRNEDDRDHEVVGDKREFRSGTIKPGKSWSRRFEEAGTFNYHCALHPRARGTITVRPE